MTDSFQLVLLSDMLEILGEERTKSILSDFICPINKDVEDFLRNKAIMFTKQGVAQTHLVYYVNENKKTLVGYFALAYKDFEIELTGKNLSSKLTHRLQRFVYYDKKSKVNRMSALLIGQLGKNFKADSNKLISGDELLEMAIDKVKEVQRIAGGRFVYIECEDKTRLKDFYIRNGFFIFNKRALEKDETDILSGKYLIQMVKYLK